jgi:hypothetical protein
MATIEAIMRFGGMSIEDALRELNLISEKCREMARNEELHWVADRISECLTRQ